MIIQENIDPEWNHKPGDDDATMLGLRQNIEKDHENSHINEQQS